MKTVRAALIGLLMTACASTPDPGLSISRTGYLLRTGNSLQLFETEAARAARDASQCVQILRNARLQGRTDRLPEGRVQVSGSELLPRGGWGDAVEIRAGLDRATSEICRSQYIFVTSITATGN